MAQIINPGRRNDEGGLGTLARALQIFSTVQDIKQKSDKAGQAEEKETAAAKGIWSRDDQFKMAAAGGQFSSDPTPGSIAGQDKDTGAMLYVTPPKPRAEMRAPQREVYRDPKTGENRIGIVDSSTGKLVMSPDDPLSGSQPKEAGGDNLKPLAGFRIKGRDEPAFYVAGKGYTDATGRPVQVEPTQKESPIKPTQYQAATYGRRVEDAINVFDNLEKSGYDRTKGREGVLSWLPSALQPNELQQQEQAERNFINAVLRRESGAAISPSEFDSAQKQYFPRSGDSPEVLAQKAQNRQLVLNGLQAEAGNAWDEVKPASLVPRRKEEKPGSGTAIAAPAKSNQGLAKPGSVVEVNGKRYVVGADGDSLTPVGGK